MKGKSSENKETVVYGEDRISKESIVSEINSLLSKYGYSLKTDFMLLTKIEIEHLIANTKADLERAKSTQVFAIVIAITFTFLMNLINRIRANESVLYSLGILILLPVILVIIRLLFKGEPLYRREVRNRTYLNELLQIYLKMVD